MTARWEPWFVRLGLAFAVSSALLLLLPILWPSRKTKGRIKSWLRSRGRWRQTVECDANKHRLERRARFRSEEPVGLYPEDEVVWRCPECGSTNGVTVVRIVTDTLAARLSEHFRGYGFRAER